MSTTKVESAATDRGKEIKICCATFYQSELVQMLLGDILHPGGLTLTHHLGQTVGLGPNDLVLDVASGRGASAIHLAERFGCRVTGLDYSEENLTAAKAHAAKASVAHLTSFRQGDAEELPFDDGAFDVVISECSFCTFPNKATAAAEMARTLSHSGRLGLTDMTVNGSLPDDVQSLPAWVACIAGAGTSEDYVSTLKNAGFSDFIVEDQRAVLLDMVADVRRKLLGLELVAGLSKLDGSTVSLGHGPTDALDNLDLSEAKRLAGRAVELIEDGVVGYTLIAARKK